MSAQPFLPWGRMSVLTGGSVFIELLKAGAPGWLSGGAVERLPLAQGVILGSWDPVPHGAPHREPASLSAYISAPLCVSLMNKSKKLKNFLKAKEGR